MDAEQPTAPPASKVAVSIVMTPKFGPSGITNYASITGQRYTVGANGRPTKVGSVVNKQWSDVGGAAGTDAALATAMAAIEAAVQAYIAAGGLD